MQLRFLFIILFLTSCAMGPNYKKPTMDIPTKFKEAGIDWVAFEPKDVKVKSNWWLIFKDNKLNELEEKLNKSNFTIQAAQSSYLQAASLVDKARTSYLPNVSATSSMLKSKNTTTSVSRSLQLQASWELDVWGNISRTVESSVASRELEAANLEAAKLSVQSSLAQFYYELMMADKNQELLDKITLAYQHILDYEKARYKKGVSGDQAIVIAEQQLELAKLASNNNKIVKAQYEHAIAALLGEFASNFSYTTVHNYPTLSIPAIVPSDVLQRRPDVNAAEMQLRIASANIGIAKSAFFPALSIVGTNTYSGTGSKKLMSLPTLAWSVGPELALNLTNLVAYKSTMKAAREAYEASAGSYKQTVVNAVADVEDNMSSLKHLNEQVKNAKLARDKSSRNLAIVENQYKAGIIDKYQVLTAKISYYSAEKTLNDTMGLKTTCAIGLIKAIGGI